MRALKSNSLSTILSRSYLRKTTNLPDIIETLTKKLLNFYWFLIHQIEYNMLFNKEQFLKTDPFIRRGQHKKRAIKIIVKNNGLDDKIEKYLIRLFIKLRWFIRRLLKKRIKRRLRIIQKQCNIEYNKIKLTIGLIALLFGIGTLFI